jgi:hypothetical protein
MKAQKKAEREADKLKRWLERAGKNVEAVEIEPDQFRPSQWPNESSLQAEAVLKYWDNPKEWIEKKCQHCGGIFATLYYAVGNCSDACRKKQLKDIGITFGPDSMPHQRWGRVPPLVVPPEALPLVKAVYQEKVLVQSEVSSDDLLESFDLQMDGFQISPTS